MKFIYTWSHSCSPLVGQTLEIAQAIHGHLIALPLADSTEGCATLEVDILVGGDYYSQFFSGNVVRGRKGPVAMESCLGYVLSGSIGSESVSAVNVVNTSHVMKLTCDAVKISERC